MYLKIFNSINHLPVSCLSIFEQNEANSLFLGRQWFKLYEQHFLISEQNRFVVIFDHNNQAIVLLLLQLIETEKKLSAPTNFYSAFFSPLASKNFSEEVLAQAYSLFITDYLLAEKFHSIELKPIQLSLIENNLLIQSLKKNHFIIDSSFYFGNWTSDISNMNFEQYYKKLPSKLKNTIKRKTKKLEKNHNYSIKIYDDIKDIQSHIHKYEKIYQLSWKTSEASTEFIRDFILNYAASGHTRLGIAIINDQVVASQFWLVHNDIALIYKLAYDPAYKEFSIGSILTAKMMQHVIDRDGVKKIDYLTGDDPYKKDWMNNRQEFSLIIAYNSHTLNGLSHGLIYLLKKMIKRLLKSLHLYPSIKHV